MKNLHKLVRDGSSFSDYVSSQLKHYVYRLIDPRNGETFYVGKGSGNRVFAHADGEPGAKDDELTDKLRRIREIRIDGFKVAHVIHRHGMTAEQAFEVEAALIDAYPEATNQVGGRAADERGLMHAKQVVERYEAQEVEFEHKALIIFVNRSLAERESVYAAVRYAWKLDPNRARRADIVLAVGQGLVIGVFIAAKWREATIDNFPSLVADVPGRWGFDGREAPAEIANQYLRRRLPAALRIRGAANPIRYVGV